MTEIEKVREEVPQPELDEYPVQSSEKFQIVDAVTKYKFINEKLRKPSGRWLAILGVNSTFYDWKVKSEVTEPKVIVYRWLWRQPSKWNPDTRKREYFGEYKWFKEQEISFTSREKFDEIIALVADMWDIVEE